MYCFSSRVSDISLEEDDVLKLALLGNNAKTKDTIDTLVKSLVIRNRYGHSTCFVIAFLLSFFFFVMYLVDSINYHISHVIRFKK